MKLYAWQPHGHGEYSFFVMAEDEDAARDAVEKYIKTAEVSAYEHSGWGTDYYELRAVGPGEVIVNSND